MPWILSSASAVGLAAIATAYTASLQAENAKLPQKSTAWAAVATTDVEASYRLLRDEHPGMLDARNPGFPRQLDGARHDALRLARRVRDAAGYSAALAVFQADMRDGHAGPFDTLPEGTLPHARWPGFVTVWRGDGLYVYDSESGQPPRGARIVGCDGKRMVDLVRANVFRFEGRPAEPGQWWQRAPHVMIDYGNPFVRAPRRCQVEANGIRQTVTLTWRPTTAQAEAWRNEAYNGDTLPVGLTQPRPGLQWIAMPTFTPDVEDVARYEALFAALERNRPTLLSARAIVIDLRHNQGGWSRWSLRVAEHLWGRTAVDEAMERFDAPQRVRWRATRGNVAALQAMAQSTLRDGDAEGSRERMATAHALREALASGRKTYDEPLEAPTPTVVPGTIESDPHTPVYVIVPGQCASSCLDAIDTFTRFPDVKLIGAPSSGDTDYIDVREQPLPSGLGLVVMPMKMYINRPRRAGQVYVPQIPMNKVRWSTAAFADAIEEDLRR